MDRVYRFIAARRYRLSCAGSACRLPGAGGAGAGGGPRAVTVVLALLVPACLTAGSSSGCSGRAPDPVTERLDAIAHPEAAALVRAFSRTAGWSFLPPGALTARGARRRSRGERPPPMASRVPSDLCDVVRLTFDEKDPSRRDDWHDIYVSRVNHLIDRIHSYRAEDRSYSVVLWSDHLTFGGVRVATRRETHATDVTGEIGPLEAVVEYSGGRFDAPFGDEGWSGMTATAPVATAAPPAVPAAAGRLQAPDADAHPDDGPKGLEASSPPEDVLRDKREEVGQ